MLCIRCGDPAVSRWDNGRPMHLTLVRPPMVLSRLAHTTPTCPPIGLAYLAGSARAAGHDVGIVDAVGEDIFRYEPRGAKFLVHGLPAETVVARIPRNTDAVGISIMFSHEFPAARDLIQRIREAHPTLPIIAGGEHVNAVAEDTLRAAPAIDAAVTGEGEETLTDVLTAIASGKSLEGIAGTVVRSGDRFVAGPPRRRIAAIDAIPEPAWDLTPISAYLDNEKGFGVNRGRSMPVLATRGCPYQCTFCSSPAMWTTRWIARDPEKLLAEMERHLALYAIDNFDFYDLTAIVKRDWIVKFCRLVIDRKHRFTWQLPSGTRSEAIDSEVCELLYASGCRNVSYAPESGSAPVLARIKKKVRVDRMTASMKSAVKNRLNVKANILLGFPGESRREMWQSLGFVGRMALLGLHDVSICSFSPYPGSELFEDLRGAGRIPELTDAYYENLACYTDVSGATSWSENVGGRELALYRIAGMLAFYGLSFASRPWRLLRLGWNVARSRQDSRLEMSLVDMLSRLTAASRTAAGRAT
ncbi:MAG: cobalamin-dependent protein [Acidobacteriota bacterium]